MRQFLLIFGTLTLMMACDQESGEVAPVTSEPLAVSSAAGAKKVMVDLEALQKAELVTTTADHSGGFTFYDAPDIQTQVTTVDFTEVGDGAEFTVISPSVVNGDAFSSASGSFTVNGRTYNIQLAVCIALADLQNLFPDVELDEEELNQGFILAIGSNDPESTLFDYFGTEEGSPGLFILEIIYTINDQNEYVIGEDAEVIFGDFQRDEFYIGADGEIALTGLEVSLEGTFFSQSEEEDTPFTGDFSCAPLEIYF